MIDVLVEFMKADDDQIVIVGSGFAGLALAIRLKQAGIDDFVILEQADRVGGTWRDNTYPGAACDVESHLYCFSFAANSDWSRSFAPQQEIFDYLERCVAEYGLGPHLRFNARVERAAFDEATGLWRIEIAGGETLSARVLVAGCGGLSRPSYPKIPGLDAFRGPAFHSARWRHDVSLEGTRVGVVGTGASAIQIVPAIAPNVAKLSLFQRTPPWIVPKPDRAYTPREKRRFARRPWRQKLTRYGLYWKNELRAAGFVVDPRIMKLAEIPARRYLEQSIADPALRAKLTPSYTMGCKRVLLSNDYYPALARDNVDVVTDSIARVESRGLRTKDGVLHELDALILATGFQAAEASAPFEMRGRGGRDLNAAWAGGPEAYLGTTVSGFPNLFLIVGPNCGLGHSSMVLMIESQVAYILSALRLMRVRRLAFVDVRPETQARYSERLGERLAGTVWASGCTSWYKTSNGKNTTLWPGFTFEFRFRTRRFDARHYELCERRAAPRRTPRAEAAALQP
jgi:cation diffusion facilitator CzcD-associated flavoprotein CzcO